MVKLRDRLSSPLTAAVLATSVWGCPALAAGLDAAGQGDLRRAFAAASLSTSEEPAVRAERRAGEPSPGFMLGAALGAWTSAWTQLDFDLKNPAAAGPPHTSQSGDNHDALSQDCAEETTAFAHLDARAAALGLDAQTVLRMSATPDGEQVLARWRARRAGPDQSCH